MFTSGLVINWVDYVIFIGLILASFLIDNYMHRDEKEVSLKSAINWTIFWIVVSFIYAGFLWLHHSSETASLFISGYLLEKVLSVDNLFVLSAIFAWFNIPNHLRHRVLYWGVIGAIVFRLIFVLVGASLIKFFGVYAELLFALMIGYAAIMMLGGGDKKEKEVDYENHIANRIVHKFWPVVPKLYGDKFFVRGSQIEQELPNSDQEEQTSIKNSLGIIKKLSWYATPLLVCTAVIELSDVMFAFDSVPAVIAVSQEPLIIYSSMLFAILGLRTMYFVLEALKSVLVHLEKAINVLLFFIAIKLLLVCSEELLGFGYEISANTSLIIVIAILACGVIASFIWPEKEQKPSEALDNSDKATQEVNSDNKENNQ